MDDGVMKGSPPPSRPSHAQAALPADPPPPTAPVASIAPMAPIPPTASTAPITPIPLAECGRHPLAEVGAKARHLAEALEAGHPVPPGIVLPCRALAGGVTEAVVEAAWEGARSLGEGPVAVRSSGVAEDGAEQSFAGQFRTMLNIRGREALAGALRACRASADSEQVRSYGRNGAQPMALLVQRQVQARSAGVAFSANPVTGARDEVVVSAVHGLGDRLVNGEVTPEELTVRGEEVERRPGAGPGGEHGRGPAGELGGEPGGGPGGEAGGEPVLDDARAREVARAALSLAETFGCPQDIEWAFDGAGDLAILQSRPITALPPEPIPVPFDPPPGTWIRNDHHFTPSPIFFGLFCNVYDTAQQRALAKFAIPVTEIRSLMLGGHLYTRMAFEGGDQEGTPPGWLLWILSRVVPSMRRMNRQARQIFRTRLHHREMREWEEVHRPRFQALLREFDPDGLEALGDEALLERWEAVVALVHEGARVHAETIGNWIAIGEFDLFGRRHLGWDLATSLQAMQGWSRATTELRDSLFELAAAHLSREEAAGALRSLDAGEAEGGAGAAGEVVGRTGNETGRAGEAPRRAARAAEVPGVWMDAHPAFRSAFHAWFRANRLRIQDYDLRNPSLGESPELVRRLLRDALEARAKDRPHPRARVDAERERILGEARERLGGTPLLEEFQELAHWCERAYGNRDENGFYTIACPLGLARLHLLEIGRRIGRGVEPRSARRAERDPVRDAERDPGRDPERRPEPQPRPRTGPLEEPVHAVYLHPEEVPAALRGEIPDLADRIARRRGEEQWARFHRGPKRLGPPEPPLPDTAPFPAPLRKLFDLLGWMMEVEPPEEDADASHPNRLRGRAASGGRHTGPARIIRSPRDFHRLQPRDVLVCRITTGEWSAAFGRVGALVTEEGGFLSHPAIIAREFGIPAVVGTEVALQRIADGDVVTVDGDAGEVWIGGSDKRPEPPTR
jgi:rifampicin phosphotransferase